MNLEKIGNFIKQLRIENKLTQQQLADKIPITREAVSKWERGKNKPDKYTLEILANLFNVTTEELILGRRNESTNIEENKQLTLTLYDENNKKQKKLKILFIILFIILILFFIYYFFVNFNSIKIYNVNYESDTLIVKDGIFITTREKFYFNFSDIKCPDEISSLKLYYKDNERDKVIYETKGKIIILYDYYQYDAYFKYKELNTVLNNLYIKIICEENEYNIKLNVKKDFANNKLFFDKQKDLLYTNNQNIQFFNNFNINLKLENFKKEKNSYIYSYKDKNYKLYYFKDINQLYLTYKKNNLIAEDWIYYLNINELEYKEYDELGNIKNSFVFSKFDAKCLIENCSIETSKIEYFFNKLNELSSN